MLRRGGGPVPKQIHSQATSFSLPSLLHLPGRGARGGTGVPILDVCPFAGMKGPAPRTPPALEGPVSSSGQGDGLSPLGGLSFIIDGVRRKGRVGWTLRGSSSAFRRLSPHSISGQRAPSRGDPGACLGWSPGAACPSCATRGGFLQLSVHWALRTPAGPGST